MPWIEVLADCPTVGIVLCAARLGAREHAPQVEQHRKAPLGETRVRKFRTEDDSIEDPCRGRRYVHGGGHRRVPDDGAPEGITGEGDELRKVRERTQVTPLQPAASGGHQVEPVPRPFATPR